MLGVGSLTASHSTKSKWRFQGGQVVVLEMWVCEGGGASVQ